jgi:hypothetical protein
MAAYTNTDGLKLRFGKRSVVGDTNIASHSTDSIVRELVVNWEYNNLPTFDQDAGGGSTVDTYSSAVAFIPAGSHIVSGNTYIKTAFAGGTTYDLGLYQRDGTAIDADGIDDDIALSAMDADGDMVVNDGAMVAPTAGANTTAYDAYFRVVATGTYTAGKARTVIRYIPPRPA